MNKNLLKHLSIEECFFKDLLSQLGEDILFYCLVGSLGRKTVIPNWSDIDILLVIRHYDSVIFDKINLAVQRFNLEVKIGITFYTLEEFNGKNYKDPKTLFYVQSIMAGLYKPRIIAKEIKLNLPTKKEIEIFNLVDFTKHLHSLKRELLLGSKYDEKKTYKIIIALLKILLIKERIPFTDYKDVLRKANKYLGKFNFNTPEVIVANKKSFNKRYDEYIYFLNWLTKNSLKIDNTK